MQPDTQQWYGGRLVTATRELEPNERLGLAELRRETIVSLGKTAALALVPLVLLYLGVSGRWLAWPALAVVLYRLRYRFWAVPAELQFVRDSKRDLAAGKVGICEGPGEKIEVLLASGLIWTRKGVRQQDITLLTSASTAAVPEHARLATNYVKPFNGDVSVHQRPLSDAELHELTSYAPGIPLLRGVGGAFTIVCALVALSAVPRYPAVIVASIVICLFITWRIGRGLASVLRTRKDVLRDVAEGYVVIVRRTGGDDRLFEVLPNSRYVWTEGGEPAAWRRT